MTDIPTEAEPFARIASGILINVGTPYQEQPSGMLKPARAAHEVRTPWVPVALVTLPLRTALASRLLNQFPTAIHGNASEVMAFVGLGGDGRVVDTTDTTESALGASKDLAHRTRKGSAGGRPVSYAREAYKRRNVVERSFNTMKQWRSLATRYDKLALTYRSAAVLQAVFIWSTALGDPP